MDALGARRGFVHRGVLHRGHHHLLDETIPLLVGALDEGHRVVVVGERALTRMIREVLGDHGSGSLSFVPPGSVPDHDDEAFTDWLRASVPTTGRLIVLYRYRAERPPPPDVALAAELEALPVTLLCACPHDAGPDDLDAFRRTHTLRARAPGPVEPSSGGLALQARFAELAHLRLLRPRIASTAAVAGFDESEQERAVLAVHEASVVACRLMQGAVLQGSVGEPARDRGTCELVASAGPQRMVAEIHLPRAVGFPSAMLDDDPLRWVRTFSDETSWSGTSRTRRLRVVIHAAQGVTGRRPTPPRNVP